MKKRETPIILSYERNHLLVVDNSGVETLGLLDVDGVDHRVQLLLGVLLVVTLAGDADTQTEGNALDTGFPDLLVELGVEADVLGALFGISHDPLDRDRGKLTIACSAKARISLIARGARFLKVTPCIYRVEKKRRNQSSARMPSCEDVNL